MDFLLQTEGDGLDRWSLFCYALISGGGKGATMSKFLSYEDRIILAQRLQENASFGAIGKELGKDRTTIAKEIKKYSHDKKSGRPGYPYNPCKFRISCKAKKLCGTSCTHPSAYKCSLCPECTLHCPDFIEDVCSVKNKPPYVCNGCSQLPKCTLLKRIYDPADAHERAHHAISEARTGILSNEGDIARINRIISPLVKNGQSLHQIYLDHVDELMCSEKTLYNYVDAQLFDIRNIDLPRKVKYRPRYKQPEFKVDRGCRIGRSYTDFQKFLENNPETTIVQMDTVIGRAGGKCLLTIHFVETSLMLAFLRDANTSASVIRIIKLLDKVFLLQTQNPLTFDKSQHNYCKISQTRYNKKHSKPTTQRPQKQGDLPHGIPNPKTNHLPTTIRHRRLPILLCIPSPHPEVNFRPAEIPGTPGHNPAQSPPPPDHCRCI